MKVSILFTRPNSIYNQLNVDCWDINRNALNWPGGNAIIAHPPCRAWGDLRGMAKPRPGEKDLAIWAIKQIRIWGGILEHPAKSQLWNELELPTGKERDAYGGWTLSIDQFWFGHKAKKKTHLYILGIEPKDIPPYAIKYDSIHTTVERLSRQAREATPIQLAKWLIQTAHTINQNINYDKTDMDNNKSVR